MMLNTLRMTHIAHYNIETLKYHSFFIKSRINVDPLGDINHMYPLITSNYKNVDWDKLLCTLLNSLLILNVKINSRLSETHSLCKNLIKSNFDRQPPPHPWKNFCIWTGQRILRFNMLKHDHFIEWFLLVILKLGRAFPSQYPNILIQEV